MKISMIVIACEDGNLLIVPLKIFGRHRDCGLLYRRASKPRIRKKEEKEEEEEEEERGLEQMAEELLYRRDRSLDFER